MKLLEIEKLFPELEVVYDDPIQLEREIEFVGPGFYSMDDNSVYHLGMFATYSRILIQVRPSEFYAAVEKLSQERRLRVMGVYWRAVREELELDLLPRQVDG